MTSENSFGARSRLEVGDASYEIFRLDAVEGAADLPYSLKVLLENLLRTEDGANTTADSIRAVAAWDPSAEPDQEIAFTPARVLMQDFTGVPCVVDLAAMRDAMVALGGDARRINPLAPAELVIDHSVVVDFFGSADALRLNSDAGVRAQPRALRVPALGPDGVRELQGRAAGDRHRPPGQPRVARPRRVHPRRRWTRTAYPDTLVGTDSHTTMINGLGVLGWGVGGIEAEAAMLGQPVSMLIPQVVGFKLTGELPEGATATDLVLTVTQLLRKQGVVGKFVEFYGPGVGNVPARRPRHDRQHGARVRLDLRASSPSTTRRCRYLRLTGRPDETVALVEAYAKAQGLWHDPSAEPRYSQRVELDLSTVVPSLAGPKRPQDRVPLDAAKSMFRTALADYASTTPVEQGRKPGVPPVATAAVGGTGIDEASAESFPASDPAAPGTQDSSDAPAEVTATGDSSAERPSNPVPTTLASGEQVTIDHGHVVIAAITSCTNTSNPYVMVGAGLLAKNAVEKGLSSKPWVKTTPRARVEGRHRLLRPRGPAALPRQAGLPDRRLRLHHLHRQQRTAARGGQRGGARGRPRGRVGAVGQPQLRGPHQPRRQDELPGVPAARGGVRPGRARWTSTSRPSRWGTTSRANPVYLTRHLADRAGSRGGRRRGDHERDVRGVLRRRVRRRPTAGRRSRCPPATRSPGTPSRPTSASPRTSRACSASRHRSPTSRARRCSPCSATRITTDHISPAGSIRRDSPAGRLPAGARRRAEGLQQLRLTPRQPRGHDPRAPSPTSACATSSPPAPRAASRSTCRRRSRRRSTRHRRPTRPRAPR